MLELIPRYENLIRADAADIEASGLGADTHPVLRIKKLLTKWSESDAFNTAEECDTFREQVEVILFSSKGLYGIYKDSEEFVSTNNQYPEYAMKQLRAFFGPVLARIGSIDPTVRTDALRELGGMLNRRMAMMAQYKKSSTYMQARIENAGKGVVSLFPTLDEFIKGRFKFAFESSISHENALRELSIEGGDKSKISQAGRDALDPGKNLWEHLSETQRSLEKVFFKDGKNRLPEHFLTTRQMQLLTYVVAPLHDRLKFFASPDDQIAPDHELQTAQFVESCLGAQVPQSVGTEPNYLTEADIAFVKGVIGDHENLYKERGRTWFISEHVKIDAGHLRGLDAAVSRAKAIFFSADLLGDALQWDERSEILRLEEKLLISRTTNLAERHIGQATRINEKGESVKFAKVFRPQWPAYSAEDLLSSLTFLSKMKDSEDVQIMPFENNIGEKLLAAFGSAFIRVVSYEQKELEKGSVCQYTQDEMRLLLSSFEYLVSVGEQSIIQENYKNAIKFLQKIIAKHSSSQDKFWAKRPTRIIG